MKHIDAARPTETPKVALPSSAAGRPKPASKPVGPVTYSVTRGSDVFWSGKQGGRTSKAG